MTKQRLRIDLWDSIRPIISAEMQRSGLTAQEVVNIALADYFGLSPKGKNIESLPFVQTEQPNTNELDLNQDDDYI